MFSHNLIVQLLEGSDLSLVLGNKLVVLFIDNFFNLLGNDLLLLVVNLLDLCGCLLMLLFEEDVLGFVVLYSHLILLLLLLHLEVELLDLALVHSLHLDHLLLVLPLDLSALVDLLLLLNHRDLLLHSHLVLNVLLLDALHFTLEFQRDLLLLLVKH